MDRQRGAQPFIGDIFIRDGLIEEIADKIDVPDPDNIIEGADKLVIPGLVNAHLHSWEALFKGRYDNMPLELWMLRAYPVLALNPLFQRLIYLRTMIVGMESLKNGVTCLVDDVIEMPGQSLDALSAVFQAYDDVGIRANCSGHIMNKPYYQMIPHLKKLLPSSMLRKIEAEPIADTDSYLAFSREAISRFHNRSGRLRYVIAPSAPQRCTEELLLATNEMSRQFDIPYHIHVLETKVQAITGQEFYRKSLVHFLNDLAVLSNRSVLVHSVWVTDEDIALIASAGASVIHNPISNLKLGSGIAPFRKFLDAGINVGLGSDGICSNDTPRMFDVMHIAGLLHKVVTPDYRKWPSAEEILRAATIGGARSACIGESIGTLEVGKKADMVILNTRTLNFSPLNDVRNHLVYCENGSSIEKVFVNGDVVVEGRKVLRVDEEAILAELREYMPQFQKQYGEIERLNQEFQPYVERVYRSCSERAIGINRFAGDEREWVVENTDCKNP